MCLVTKQEKAREIFDDIVNQLSKENKKFQYSKIRKGARSKDYKEPLLWLIDQGLIYKINRIKTPDIPLGRYTEKHVFKLYFLDIGLFNALGNFSKETVLIKNNKVKESKGAMTEQYVCQELVANKLNPCYWANTNSSAEIDFVINIKDNVIPIEAKAELNLQAKSLKSYNEKYNPKLCVRTSMANYKKQDWVLNLPLWAISEIKNIEID